MRRSASLTEIPKIELRHYLWGACLWLPSPRIAKKIAVKSHCNGNTIHSGDLTSCFNKLDIIISSVIDAIIRFLPLQDFIGLGTCRCLVWTLGGQNEALKRVRIPIFCEHASSKRLRAKSSGRQWVMKHSWGGRSGRKQPQGGNEPVELFPTKLNEKHYESYFRGLLAMLKLWNMWSTLSHTYCHLDTTTYLQLLDAELDKVRRKKDKFVVRLEA